MKIKLANGPAFMFLSLLVLTLSSIAFHLPQQWHLESADSYYSIRESTGNEIIIKCPLPTVPDTIPSLRVTYQIDATEERALMIARKVFNFTGEVTRLPEFEGYRIRDGYNDLWISDSGGIDYITPQNLFPKNLPTVDEAKATANEFVERVKSFGLAPQDPRVRIVFDEVLSGTETTAPSTGTAVGCWDVHFVVKFDDIELLRDVVVSVGQDGQVTGFQGFWRELEQEGDSYVIPPEQAIERLISSSYGKSDIQPTKVVIEQMRLVYLDDKYILFHQDYLKPVYFFSGVLIDENGEHHLAQWVSADR